jgi:hypothetical protein
VCRNDLRTRGACEAGVKSELRASQLWKVRCVGIKCWKWGVSELFLNLRCVGAPCENWALRARSVKAARNPLLRQARLDHSEQGENTWRSRTQCLLSTANSEGRHQGHSEVGRFEKSTEAIKNDMPTFPFEYVIFNGVNGLQLVVNFWQRLCYNNETPTRRSNRTSLRLLSVGRAQKNSNKLIKDMQLIESKKAKEVICLS